VFTISNYSASPIDFAAQQRGEASLWQLEIADRGNFMEISNLDLEAATKLHLLPFDHCGKATDSTRLPM
jgi:hypothetical protein